MLLCIGIGNPLRGDDGVAHRAVELISPQPDVHLLYVYQLTPELASDISGADTVFFIDADATCDVVTFSPIGTVPPRSSPLTHRLSPAELVELARRLYGFAGEVFACRLPAKQFGDAEQLSPEAETAAQIAAKMISERIRQGTPTTSYLK